MKKTILTTILLTGLAVLAADHLNITVEDPDGLTWQYSLRDNTEATVERKDGWNWEHVPNRIDVPQHPLVRAEEIWTVAIGERAFVDSKFSRIVVPASVRSIGPGAFMNSYVSAMASSADLFENRVVKIPSTITNLGASAFRYCKNLDVVRLPTDMTNLNTAVFAESSIRQLNGQNIRSLGDGCFMGCTRLEDYSNLGFGSDLVSIPKQTFSKSSVTRAFLGNSITNVGPYAFAYCPKLAYVSVRSDAVIAPTAFVGSTNVVVRR